MKLLITAQVIDTANPELGFFCRWVEELATRVEQVEVICLKEGTHNFPQNVRVHSLGKERGLRSRLAYAATFLGLVWDLRHEYDAVFVHQNQEYVIIAGPFWRLTGKRVYLWRNHYAGSFLTHIAAFFSTTVFCTSKHSYTARFSNTVFMQVGIDTKRFLRDMYQPEPRSILFLARMASSKRPEMVIDALGELLARGESFTADFVGSPLSKDEGYYRSLNTRAESAGLRDRVRFLPAATADQTPSIFAAHEYFINASPSGMFDKTIFEAAASGSIVLAASEDFRSLAGEQHHFSDALSLCERLLALMREGEDERARRRIHLQSLARQESLETLMDRLVQELSPDMRAQYTAGI